MKRIILLSAVTALLVLALAVPASAEPQGNGPPGCIVPGTLIEEAAKRQGSTPDVMGGPPGQAMRADCDPGGS